MTGDVLSREALAKINLYLHVVGRRADGYHLLDSLVAFAGIGDRLSVTAANRLRLSVSGPFAACLEGEPDNLVLRAARRLAEAGGVAAHAHISLEKNLPVAAGLGGGSADAAAVLHLLSRLWRLDPAPADLDALALGLGADVPICLGGVAAFVGGVGEKIEPVGALPPAWLVLVNPGVALATRDIFARWNEPAGTAGRFPLPVGDLDRLVDVLASCRNDLTGLATGLCPPVGIALARLSRTEGCLLARMSGSGATCFGVFADEPAARAAAAALGDAHDGWWVAPAPLMDGLSSAPSAQ